MACGPAFLGISGVGSGVERILEVCGSWDKGLGLSAFWVVVWGFAFRVQIWDWTLQALNPKL